MNVGKGSITISPENRYVTPYTMTTRSCSMDRTSIHVSQHIQQQYNSHDQIVLLIQWNSPDHHTIASHQTHPNTPRHPFEIYPRSAWEYHRSTRRIGKRQSWIDVGGVSMGWRGGWARFWLRGGSWRMWVRRRYFHWFMRWVWNGMILCAIWNRMKGIIHTRWGDCGFGRGRREVCGSHY